MEVIRALTGEKVAPGCVLVPTMGALHGGHASLIRLAREREPGRPCIVSVFVNPIQFNDPSDFARYPRTLDDDTRLCARAGCDVLWAPEAEEIYPPGAPVVTPDLPVVATTPGLEDAFRPGHFAGVARVVARLFELVRPAAAVFGEKDWQQLQLVRSLAARAAPPVRIIQGETVREEDGLAMSSRNRFLSPGERRAAVAIPRALEIAGMFESPDEAERAMRARLTSAGLVVEYAVVRSGESLGETRGGVAARALIAARAGVVRLIDNAPWSASRVVRG